MKCVDEKHIVLLGDYSLQVSDIISTPQNLYCKLCGKILVNPQETPCGCRYCYSCIKDFLQGEILQCPGETNKCNLTWLQMDKNIHCDMKANREISSLIVKCCFNPCTHQSEVRRMVEHICACTFRTTLCKECGASVRVADAERHRRNDCDKIQASCEYCGKQIIKDKLNSSHLNFDSPNLCLKYEGICPRNCGETAPVNWADHRRVCMEGSMECSYKSVGCRMTFNRKNMSSHMRQDVERHSEMTLKVVEDLQNELGLLKKRFDEMAKKLSESEDARQRLATDLCQTVGVLIWRISEFSKQQGSGVMSPLFFTADRGYRMRLTLFPNGCREKGFVSIGISLQRGEFDNELQWPLRKAVTVRLCDQEHGDHHWTQMIEFDPDGVNKLHCERPTTNTGKLLMISKFINRKELMEKTHLIKRDVVIIQCFVDDI